MSQLPLNNTLQEAKSHLRNEWNKGTNCPCCGQFVKLYERKLNVGMTLFLIGLYKLDPQGASFHHAKEVLKQIGAFTTSRDYSILEYFKLTQSMPNTDDDKRTSGYWKLTQLGREFVLDRAEVPSHIRIFNNKSYGVTGSRITVRGALSSKFNYDELMGFTR